MTLQLQLQNGLNAMQLPLDDHQQQALLKFIDLLIKWNKQLNLTAIDDPDDIVVKHIFDSLSIVPYLQGQRIADVGTGAGLPGLVLAIALPEKQFTLIDSNNKKISFLHQAAYELGVSNVTAIKTRIEEYAAPHCFDTIVSRAFSTINDMIVKTSHLLCNDGQILAMKGRYPLDELQHIPAGFCVKEIHPLHVQGLTAERHVVSVIKQKI